MLKPVSTRMFSKQPGKLNSETGHMALCLLIKQPKYIRMSRQQVVNVHLLLSHKCLKVKTM